MKDEPMEIWPEGLPERVQFYNAGANQWVLLSRTEALVLLPEKLPDVMEVEFCPKPQPQEDS